MTADVEGPLQQALPRVLATYKMINPDGDSREAEVRLYLIERLTAGVDDPERLIVEGLTFLLQRGPVVRAKSRLIGQAGPEPFATQRVEPV